MNQRQGRIVLLSSAAVCGGLLFGTMAPAGGAPEDLGGAKELELEVTDTSLAFRALSASSAVQVELANLPVTTLPPTTTTAAPTTAPPVTAPPTTAPPTTAPPVTEAPPVAEAPPPPPAPVPSGSAEEAIAAWFPEVYDKALRVAACESSLDPGAVSAGGGNHGLFQINNVHRSSFSAVTGQPWSAVYDAYANAQFARHLYDSSGWQPWGCRGA